nr:uncharacterized protein CTRU02_10431 [Colletotrichum truncatum]KAF6787168.1 hypothetical protein CTRU02_10431 [Colletotrichum truncatum]
MFCPLSRYGHGSPDALPDETHRPYGTQSSIYLLLAVGEKHQSSSCHLRVADWAVQSFLPLNVGFLSAAARGSPPTRMPAAQRVLCDSRPLVSVPVLRLNSSIGAKPSKAPSEEVKSMSTTHRDK